MNKIILISYLLIIFMNFSIVNAEIDISSSKISPPFKPLSENDRILYKNIFLYQELGDLKKSEQLLKKVDNQLLIGNVLSQKYLHPTAWRSSFKELSNWLKKYNDHPAASRIKWLSNKRKPKNYKSAKSPKKGYLNGVGLSKPQSYRAYIPESWSGRRAPKQTAFVAQKVRKAIRRKRPSSALKLLNSKNNTNYLTKSEEAHLRGEIAHAYFVFGYDDKAIRTARTAIAKSPKTAWTAYWAAGLAAWRSKKYELSLTFFKILADSKNSPDVLKSGGAFWTQRALMRLGRPKEAINYLDISTQNLENFYAIVSLESKGQEFDIDFTLPTISENFIKWMESKSGGHRSMALLQVGNWTEAEREIRYLYEECPKNYKVDMISFAAKYNMPGLAFRLADIYRNETGINFYGALFPLIKTRVNFKIDEALVLSIVRKESGFNPLAKSRAKALGLMQLIPSTAAFISKDRSFRSKKRHLLLNPEKNLILGQDYIEYLFNEHHIKGNLIKMLAAYNAGPGNLKKWLQKIDYDEDIFLLIESIPSRETRSYIKGVLYYMFIYRKRLKEPNNRLQSILSKTAIQNLIKSL